MEEGNAGTKALVFTLKLNEAPSEAITVNYETLTTGTATPNGDFLPTAGTVVFAAGQTTASVQVAVSGDTAFEANETVQVKFSGARLATDVTGVGTIANDDVDPDNAPRSINLTIGVDSGAQFTGAAGDDTFYGVDAVNDETDTLNTGDRVVGGAGTDTVILSMNDSTPAGGDQAALQTSSIEVVQIAASAATTLSAANWSGVEVVEVSGAGRNLATTSTVTVSDLTSNATLKLTNVGTLASLDNALNAEYDNGAVGTNGALRLVTSGVGGANADGSDFTYASIGVTANANVFTELNITANGASRIGLEGRAADDFDLQLITITGVGAVSLDMNADSVFSGADTIPAPGLDEVNVVDASGTTGGVTIRDTLGNAENVTITGGSGNDNFTVDVDQAAVVRTGGGNDLVTLVNATAANLNASDVIDGGAGTDTLILTSANATGLDDGDAGDKAALARISGFERLRVSNDLAGDLNVQPFGVNYLALGDDVSDTVNGAVSVSVTGLTSGATIEFRDNAAMTDTLVVVVDGATAPGSTETLNLLMNANLSNQAGAGIQYNLNVEGIENLVITTADRANADGATTRDDGYVLSVAAGVANLEKITVSGTAEFSFTAAATATSLEVIDAAGLSGDLLLDLDGISATNGAAITGGSGFNNIVGTTLADVIRGGALGDVIEGDLGADTMAGGAGVDTFAINQGTDSEVTVTGTRVTGFDVITDFSGDLIDLAVDGVIAGGAGGTPVPGVSVVITAGGKASFAAEDDTLAEKVTTLAADNANIAANDIVFFEHGGDTYIYGAIAGGAEDDYMIQLVGVTGLTTMSIEATVLTLL